MAIENAPITNDDGSEFTINDLANVSVDSVQYAEADSALRDVGMSAETALDAVKSMNKEM